ncbi:MAG: hypothetical protein IJ365_08490 [Clostridia bacterium]|nr:hypothetical protein [Clostridia bacterium]
MNKKIMYIMQGVLGVGLFVVMCLAGDTNFNIPAHIAFLAYLVYLGAKMFRRSDAFMKKVDSIGTWDEIRCMIFDINPKAKMPGKHSSQRYIWFAWQKYNFGDEELERLKQEYKPYVVLFYGLVIALVFKLI